MKYILFCGLFAVAALFAQEQGVHSESHGIQNQAVVKELKAYRLSMDGIRKFANAQKAIYALESKNPNLKDRLEAFNHDSSNAQAASMDEVSAKFEKQFPRVAAAIHAQGFTPKEYVSNMILLLEAMFTGAMGGQGFGPPPPELSAENVTFLKAHAQEIGTILQPVMQPQGAGSPPPKQ